MVKTLNVNKGRVKYLVIVWRLLALRRRGYFHSLGRSGFFMCSLADCMPIVLSLLARVHCKTVHIFRIQVHANSQTKGLERDWGETLKIRTVRFAYIIFVRITRFSGTGNSRWLNFDANCYQAVKLCFQQVIHDFPFRDEFIACWNAQFFSNLRKHRSAVSNLCSARRENSWRKILLRRGQRKVRLSEDRPTLVTFHLF